MLNMILITQKTFLKMFMRNFAFYEPEAAKVVPRRNEVYVAALLRVLAAVMRKMKHHEHAVRDPQTPGWSSRPPPVFFGWLAYTIT